MKDFVGTDECIHIFFRPRKTERHDYGLFWHSLTGGENFANVSVNEMRITNFLSSILVGVSFDVYISTRIDSNVSYINIISWQLAKGPLYFHQLQISWKPNSRTEIIVKLWFSPVESGDSGTSFPPMLCKTN